MSSRSRLAALARACRIPAAAACLAASALSAADAPAPRKSPFLPPATGGAAEVSANEAIEFAGVVAGKTTHLIFHDKTAKKNRWVQVGETVEGISVVSYDARRDQVVVKINGNQKVLALRKATGPVNAPAAVAALPPAAGFNVPSAPPPAAPTTEPLVLTPTTLATTAATPVAAPTPAPQPAGPATPEIQQKQETEARMLVSDLLEIGMAQRRAYEEAQRKAASAQPDGAQPAPPATPAP